MGVPHPKRLHGDPRVTGPTKQQVHAEGWRPAHRGGLNPVSTRLRVSGRGARRPSRAAEATTLGAPGRGGVLLPPRVDRLAPER